MPEGLKTPLLGLVVALLGWKVGMSPPSVGLDLSWNAGLAMAVKDGLQFGTEVIFPYGPLGFLQAQGLWFGDLGVVTFLFSAALYVTFSVALVAALRRTLPVLPAVVIALVVVMLPLLEEPMLVAVLIAMGALARERSERAIYALAVGGATFAAIESLVKLSTGPLIAILFLVALVGLRARRWQIALFLTLLAGEFILFWLIAGQDLSGIPGFLQNTWQIVSGYSAAMTRQVDVPSWKVNAATACAAVVSVGLVVAAARAEYRDRRARWAGTILIAIAAFATFKEGVVRPDAGHLSVFFSTACVFWIAIPWARLRRRWMLAGAAAVVLVGIPVRPPGPKIGDPIANVRYAGEQVRTLFSGSRRAEISAAGRAGMTATYRLDPLTQAALRGRSVDIEPWEVGVAWAYRLDWDPLPVFQNYSAYTSELDYLNSAAVQRPDGPERILRENPALVFPEFLTRTVDNRYPAWDPPAVARAELCHFDVLRTTARWQVLGRTPDRCSRPRPAGSLDAQAGAAVRVPRPGPGEVVFARIDGADVAGLERLQALLLHADTRHAVLDGRRRFRLVPGTAADGLLLRGSDRIGGSGAFAQIPQAKTIAVTGTDGGVHLDFFRMRVRAAVPPPPEG